MWRLDDTIHQDIDAIRRDIAAQQEKTNARLDRMGGAVNGGARSLVKLLEWSEKSDETAADVLRPLADVESRLNNLESDRKRE